MKHKLHVAASPLDGTPEYRFTVERLGEQEQ